MAAAPSAANNFGVSASSSLAQPGQVLSGQSLIDAAKALANAQTIGPLTELARQIAMNNTQGKNAEALTSGYFKQVGQQAQQGVTDTNQIGSALNQQLGSIADSTNQALRGFGQDAQSNLLKYAPQGEGGLANPAMQSLATEIARQQGIAAQQEGIQRTLAASNASDASLRAAGTLPVIASQGQQSMGDIARATALENEPLNSKVAALKAQEGSLFATDLGRLRQQEITNSYTQQGLNIKGITADANANAANARAKASTYNINPNNPGSTAAKNVAQIDKWGFDSNPTLAGSQAWYNEMRINVEQNRGGAKPLSTAANNQATAAIGQALAAIPGLQKSGATEQQIRNALQNGSVKQNGRSIGKIPGMLVEAAYELLGYGSIDKSTSGALYMSGMRNTTWRNPKTGALELIKVTPDFQRPGIANLPNTHGQF